MKFSELIDRESMLLDRKRLAEWKQNAGKFELFTKINGIRDKFIEANAGDEDWKSMELVYRLTEEIKTKI